VVCPAVKPGCQIQVFAGGKYLLVRIYVMCDKSFLLTGEMKVTLSDTDCHCTRFLPAGGNDLDFEKYVIFFQVSVAFTGKVLHHGIGPSMTTES
jgi:hypothetical protein